MFNTLKSIALDFSTPSTIANYSKAIHFYLDPYKASSFGKELINRLNKLIRIHYEDDQHFKKMGFYNEPLDEDAKYLLDFMKFNNNTYISRAWVLIVISHIINNPCRQIFPNVNEEYAYSAFKSQIKVCISHYDIDKIPKTFINKFQHADVK